MVFVTVNAIKCLTGQEVFGREWLQLRRQGYLWPEEGPRWQELGLELPAIAEINKIAIRLGKKR